MEKKLFRKLVESMQQHEEIRRGKRAPSRVFQTDSAGNRVVPVEKTLTIGISTLEEMGARFIEAWKTRKPQGSHISFVSDELLLKILTPKRLLLLKTMLGRGPMTVRNIAGRLKRDIGAVQKDVDALVKSGVIDKARGGKAIFPYEAVHVDFMLRAP